MPEWATFVGFVFVVTSGLLVLSHASRGVVTDGSEADDRHEPTTWSVDPGSHTDADGSGHVNDPDRQDPHDAGRDSSVPDAAGSANRPSTVGDADASDASDASDATPVVDHRDGGPDPDPERIAFPDSGVTNRPAEPGAEPEGRGGDDADSLSTTSLLTNVAVSQGLFGVLLLVGAWYAEVPLWAFGAGPSTTGLPAVAAGIGLGVGLYVANEAGAAVGSRFGLNVGDGQRLRGALAPDTRSEWALLLLVVLPVIAGFEEVLFRGALVGVVAAGYDVSPWVMAVVASGAFAIGHGAQGRLGVVVTGALGLVLAAAFVVTGSLLVVIVAHYLVNALEFVVHEGIGVEWPPEAA